MKSFVFFASVGSLIGGQSLSAAEIEGRDSPHRIADHYIVKLKDDGVRNGLSTTDHVQLEGARLAQAYGIRVIHPYTSVFAGFAIKASDEQIEALAQDATVERIEANKVVRLNATQTPATWGLDRIDARTGINNAYNFTSTGQGVHAYVVDTGVRSTHNEFKGRLGAGFSSIADNNGTNDCNGHGTHVAGTVGGTTFGVAKAVTIHPVRVLDCAGAGSNAGVIAGIDFVAKNAIKPAVANMSLGGPISLFLDEAVKKAIQSGVTFVVAAGNENANACGVSPANVPEAITVGSTARTDSRSSFSNFGRCVDIFAPGSGIQSAGIGNDSATAVLSGTSMASPHAAGVAALLLEQNPAATPAEITTLLKKNGTANVVRNPGNGSPNLFLFSNPIVTFEPED